jgi:leader peptidase (prepilin peptidase)/N-methyltransferase
MWPSIFLIVAAPFVGSFLGVVVDRVPDGRSVARGRSACDHCGAHLALRDLVPIVGWLMQRGRCRRCGGQIDRLYPLLEGAALLAAVWSLVVMPAWLAWPTAMLGWVLLVLAAIDFRHLLLPDVLTLPLVPCGLAMAWWAGGWPLWTYAAAAMAGYALVAGLRWAYHRLRGREGIGLGDAKLMAAAGAWVGLDGLASVLLLAGVLGLVFYALRARFGGLHGRDAESPFGPWIAAALWLTWLYGPLQLA